MLKRRRGFTLIELLITIGIIAILAMIVVPNVLNALNRSKQKSTMKDIASVSTAIADYITENGTAPTQNGTYDASEIFYNKLSPLYLKVLPINDKWGNNFRVWCGSAAAQYGISSPGSDDFMAVSFGRDNKQDSFTFDPEDPEAGFYVVHSMGAFNNDLIMWNGSWIRRPGIPFSGSSDGGDGGDDGDGGC